MPQLSREAVAEWDQVPTRDRAGEEDENCVFPRWYDLPYEWDIWARWASLEPWE